MPPHVYPGYCIERNRNGTTRHRVRVERQPGKKITIPCGPDDPAFSEHYFAARAGKTHDAPAPAPVSTVERLKDDYLAHLEQQIQGGTASPLTLSQRKSQLNRFCTFTDPAGDPYAELHHDLPPAAIVHVMDNMATTPGEAHNMLKSVRAMYRFAVERERVKVNPAAGIKSGYKNQGGAKPWTPADVKAFLTRHTLGTQAHLWLTLMLFAAPRVTPG